MLNRGYSVKQAKQEIELLVQNSKEFTRKEREEKKIEKANKYKHFKEEFKKLCELENGKRINKRRN